MQAVLFAFFNLEKISSILRREGESLPSGLVPWLGKAVLCSLIQTAAQQAWLAAHRLPPLDLQLAEKRIWCCLLLLALCL